MLSGVTAAAGATPPNVVVVMVDDMGYGGLSCFDNRHFETPEIDRLAADGVKLTDYHSNGSVCSPTRAALLTGRYPTRTGIDQVVNADPKLASHRLGLDAGEWTFAEAMKSAGYATAVFGKWHLGYTPEFFPTRHGFDEFKGFISGNIDAHSHRDRMKTQDWWQNERLDDQPGYHTDLITDNAIDFIERRRDRPFFVYVAHGTPHSPHQARGSVVRRGPLAGRRARWSPEETYSETPGADDWLIRHFILPVDESIGRLRAKLEELGLADNTVFWFISDNGGTKQNHTTSSRTRAAKASFFEGGHRVPGIVWAPGRITPGTVCDEFILSFDIMPTSLATAGVAPPPGHTIDGRDVGPALFDGEALTPVVRFWRRVGSGGALRDGDWKLVLQKNSEPQLFNLATDPQEKGDVAKNYPDRVAAMVDAYQEMVSEALADSPYAG